MYFPKFMGLRINIQNREENIFHGVHPIQLSKSINDVNYLYISLPLKNVATQIF